MILKGKIAEPIRIHGKIGKAFPTFTVTFKDGNNTLQQVQVKQGRTATYNGTVPAKDGNAFLGWVLSEPSSQIVDSDNVTAYQQISNVQSDVTCWAVYQDKYSIPDSWDIISQRSQEGTASNYYNIGDMKRIHIEGTVGTLAVNQDVYVYILGFDHNSELEGSGITFGCFKDVNDLTDIALVDRFYNVLKKDGTHAFTMNHLGLLDGSQNSNNYGGWSKSDIRYDILGSTDRAPRKTDSWSVENNPPTSTCATNPVANTLMSCLPLNLREKMKPIIKYTNNHGFSSNASSDITSTTDYLPLLSEYEVQGMRAYANEYEQNKQSQYAYFAVGNNKIKYKHNDKTVSCNWWVRSPYYRSDYYFCYINGNGTTYADIPNFSIGLAPIFLV